MMKKFLSILLALALLWGTNFGWAQATPTSPPGLEKKPPLEKRVFIHRKKAPAKPPWAGSGNGKNKNKCYGFLSIGAKWKELPVNYLIDPDNQDGLTEDFITQAISLSAEEWDNVTRTELFGSYSIDHNASWDINFPDGRNELLFDNYPDSGVIAVAVVWGYFTGPPELREIIEFDVLFDTDWVWGNATQNPELMDLQNIATHEIGHGAGMGDVYETTCSEVTMYGFSGYGELIKRTLEKADITGLRKLYGR